MVDVGRLTEVKNSTNINHDSNQTDIKSGAYKEKLKSTPFLEHFLKAATSP